jgi:anti-anti-sigma factor
MKKEPANNHQPASGRLSDKSSKSLDLNFEARHGGVLVLHCDGQMIQQNEARKLSAIVSEVLPSARRMVVDLSGIKALDSDGLGELVITHMWAEAAGFELKFASPSRALRDQLEHTNLVSIFDLYSSVPEAIEAMNFDRDWKAQTGS